MRDVSRRLNNFSRREKCCEVFVSAMQYSFIRRRKSKYCILCYDGQSIYASNELVLHKKRKILNPITLIIRIVLKNQS